MCSFICFLLRAGPHDLPLQRPYLYSLYYRIAALRLRDSGAPRRLVTAVRGCGVPTRALRHVRPADDEMAHYHDSSVSIVSADKVLTSDAYILSYAKRGVVGA